MSTAILPHGPTTPAAAAPAICAETAVWFFENSVDLFVVTDYDGHIIQLNPAWTTLLGWGQAELQGRTIPELAHPNDLQDVRLSGEILRRDGQARHILRLPCRSGAWRWVQGSTRLTANGELVAVFRDITEDQAYKAELQELRTVRTLLAESAGVASWTFDPETDLISWSRELETILGHSSAGHETLEGFVQLVHPSDQGLVLTHMREAIRNGGSGVFEHRVLDQAGDCARFRVTYRTEPHLSGRFTFYGLCQNITEIAEARDAALMSERQVGQLVEGAPFAAAMYDKGLRHIVVSPRWPSVFGHEREDYLGRSLPDVFPRMPRRFHLAQRRALAGEVVSRAEDRFTDANGESRWVRWEVRPWRDGSGAVAGVVAYVDNVTDLVTARQEANANARRLKLALRAAGAGVFEIDYDTETCWYSPEFIDLVGRRLTFDDVRNEWWSNLHPDDVQRVRDGVAAWDPKRPEPLEVRLQHPDGAWRWSRFYYELKREPGGRRVKRTVGMVIDIDERKRQEIALAEAEQQASAATEAKSRFLANMSHEIRTPMNGVMGVMQLLRREPLSQDGQALLDEALGCGRMLAEILNDVIDFSKIEAGRLELAPEPVHPRNLVDGLISLLRPDAVGKGLTLRTLMAEDLDWVSADPVRLRQCLFNLVGNAVKFTTDGHVEVRVSRIGEGADQRLRFEIEDTGVGIPEAAQPALFERFHQADASSARRFGGSGLGLVISRRLAELMGGAVGFISQEGIGSTFFLEIAAPAASAPTADEEEILGLRPLHVLVVDDNPTNRMIVARVLEASGLSVETAEDGEAAVAAAARGGFDLILMDVQMPGMDGLEATRHIRALSSPQAAAPILALTANVMAHQTAAYRANGMNGVVAKPISAPTLLAEIARATRPANDELAVA